jgi:hypothetical protein
LKSRTAAAGTLALVALTGCTDRDVLDPAREQAPITHGTLSEPKDDAVVFVQGPNSGCTGTLIAPNVVLTALHCITDTADFAQIHCLPDGSLASDSSGGEIGPFLEPAQVTVRVGVYIGDSVRTAVSALYGTGTTQVCRDDLGLIVLESAPDTGGAPLVPLRFGPSSKGEPTRLIGYGDTAGTTPGGRRERKDIPLLGVGAPTIGGTGDPGASPRTLLIGEGACHGDSGGPIFSQETGAELGVYSLLLSGTCLGSDVRNTYTQIAPWEGLIRDVLESAGHEPIVEVPVGTGGTGGGVGAGGEAGEPGAAGAGGAAAGEGAGGGSDGTGATGGTGAEGGSGGKGGSGATGGRGGTATTGGTGGSAGRSAGGTDSGTGSGSRRDPSCTCRLGDSTESLPWSLGALFGALLTVARRRYRR